MNEFPTETNSSPNSHTSDRTIRSLFSELLHPSHLFADTKTAFRSLWRTPTFSLSVIAILSVDIGANVTIFTALFDTSLKPLPYPDPDADRITYVFNSLDNAKQGASRGLYLAFEKVADLFESFALIASYLPTRRVANSDSINALQDS